MDIEKLLNQVDCNFAFGKDQPYTSASSRDKARFHVWAGMEDRFLLFDSEADLIEFIIKKHLAIVERLREQLDHVNEGIVEVYE